MHFQTVLCTESGRIRFILFRRFRRLQLVQAGMRSDDALLMRGGEAEAGPSSGLVARRKQLKQQLSSFSVSLSLEAWRRSPAGGGGNLRAKALQGEGGVAVVAVLQPPDQIRVRV